MDKKVKKVEETINEQSKPQKEIFKISNVIQTKKEDTFDKILERNKSLSNNNDTLKSSYNKLMDAIVSLFIANWKNIKSKKVIPIKQKGPGTYHKSSDKNSYLNLLTNGWDTELKEIEGKAINA